MSRVTIADLKDQWREENWERKANGIPRITWASFKLRADVWRSVGTNTEGKS